MPDLLYPGVYVSEVAFAARPIDGVATSTDGLLAAGRHDRSLTLPVAPQPEWTDHNTHDPGTTIVEVLDYALLPLHFGVAAALQDRALLPGFGVASGLAVAPHDGNAARVVVSAGVAVASDGTVFEPAAAHTLRWPPFPPG